MTSWKSSKPIYIYCPECKEKAWIEEDHAQHHEESLIDSVVIGGVSVIKDFVSEEEENHLVTLSDTRQPWVPSQEGRCKQDYGPKVSFLKQKVSVGDFRGFPDFSVNLFYRMQMNYPTLFNDFIPVEFCILEYRPDRGSYIRPHYDDKWIWGDRLVTVNLLSETCLRLTREFNIPPYEIMIKMPARSLIVISGEARYEWHHSINRYDIKSRRIALTWREFSDEIVKDDEYQDFVSEVLTIAKQSIIK